MPTLDPALSIQLLHEPLATACLRCCSARRSWPELYGEENLTAAEATNSVARDVRQEHEKASIRIRPETGFRGWQQLGSNVTRYDGGFQRDMHEALDFYKEEDPLRVQVPLLHAPDWSSTMHNMRLPVPGSGVCDFLPFAERMFVKHR